MRDQAARRLHESFPRAVGGPSAHFGQPGEWAGADLVADWFRRNMRIYRDHACRAIA